MDVISLLSKEYHEGKQYIVRRYKKEEQFWLLEGLDDDDDYGLDVDDDVHVWGIYVYIYMNDGPYIHTHCSKETTTESRYDLCL